MNLKQLLLESAEELRDRPSFFIPKLVVSLIGSIWMLGLLYTIGDPLTADPGQNMDALISGLIFFPVILFLGILSPVIVAEMVKNNGKLLDSTKRSLSYTPRLAVAAILLITIFTVLILPAYIGFLAFFLQGSILALVIGSTITLTSVILLSYAIYFMPITLTENSAFESMKLSFKTSNNHKKEVSMLMLFSFSLLALAAFSSGAVRGLGVIGFILGRAISSALTTYTVIISPKMYLEAD